MRKEKTVKDKWLQIVKEFGISVCITNIIFKTIVGGVFLHLFTVIIIATIFIIIIVVTIFMAKIRRLMWRRIH